MMLHPKVARLYQKQQMELRDLIRMEFISSPTKHLEILRDTLDKQGRAMDKLIDSISDESMEKYRNMSEED